MTPQTSNADHYTVLAISALIHGTSEAVRATAKELAKNATGSVRKKTLLPLADSPAAYDIIYDTMIKGQYERRLGHAWRDGVEYDLVVTMDEGYQYTVNELFDLVLENFIRRGITTGWLRVAVENPETRFTTTRNFDMADVVKTLSNR